MTSKLAFTFPGQGSQALAMLADLADQSLVTDTFAEASNVLGYDLWDLVQNDDQGKLNQTHITQPALLTASVALWRLWCAHNGQQPALMAGHSLGEYSALVCAGAISFTDAVDLVRARGEYMQAAVPAGTGAMAAIIGLADEQIAEACAASAAGEIVAPVNYNSPGQVVIAGAKEAVERAMLACKEAGAKRALPLPVSVPSHCALMQPAAEQLAEKLSAIEVTMPDIPVIQNVNAQAA
ncbi:MAG: ACP S-malonyltransferase, partial [Pseudomonadales bacterium]